MSALQENQKGFDEYLRPVRATPRAAWELAMTESQDAEWLGLHNFDNRWGPVCYPARWGRNQRPVFSLAPSLHRPVVCFMVTATRLQKLPGSGFQTLIAMRVGCEVVREILRCLSRFVSTLVGPCSNVVCDTHRFSQVMRGFMHACRRTRPDAGEACHDGGHQGGMRVGCVSISVESPLALRLLSHRTLVVRAAATDTSMARRRRTGG